MHKTACVSALCAVARNNIPGFAQRTMPRPTACGFARATAERITDDFLDNMRMWLICEAWETETRAKHLYQRRLFHTIRIIGKLD